MNLPPYYYLVGDVPVKVYYEEATKTLCAENDLGNPWPPIKAMRTGQEITEAEFAATQLNETRKADRDRIIAQFNIPASVRGN